MRYKLAVWGLKFRLICPSIQSKITVYFSQHILPVLDLLFPNSKRLKLGWGGYTLSSPLVEHVRIH